MNDPRFARLAEILIDHSCSLRSGENVLIEAFDLADPTLVCRLVELAAARGARPLVSRKDNAILRSVYSTATVESMQLAPGARLEYEPSFILRGLRGLEIEVVRSSSS